MKLRLFTFVAALSLLAAVAVLFMWCRSCYSYDEWSGIATGRSTAITSGKGYLYYRTWTLSPPLTSYDPWNWTRLKYWPYHLDGPFRFFETHIPATSLSPRGYSARGFWIHYSTLLVVLSLAPAWWLIRAPRWRTRQRLKLGLCPECGYDLRASEGRCPECGRDFQKVDRGG